MDSSHKSFLCFSGEIVQRTESRHCFGKAHPAPLLRFLCISPPLRPPTTSLHIHPVSILLIFPHFYLLQPLLLGKRTTILQRREESLSCQIWMHVMCRNIKRRAVCAPLLRLAAAFRNARLWGFSYFILLFWRWFESKRSIKSNSTFIQISNDLPSPVGGIQVGFFSACFFFFFSFFCREPRLAWWSVSKQCPLVVACDYALPSDKSILEAFWRGSEENMEEVVGIKPRSGRRCFLIWNLDGVSDIFIPQAAHNKQKRSSDLFQVVIWK